MHSLALVAKDAAHDPTRHAAAAEAFGGWYDSSFELKRGLLVTEHVAPEAMARPSAPAERRRPESLVRWIGAGEARKDRRRDDRRA